MAKIRMNTELRNKLFNKIKHTFENEDTQEREAFLQAREEVDSQYGIASIKINVFIFHTMKMLMMTATQKKLNHILILVCLVI